MEKQFAYVYAIFAVAIIVVSVIAIMSYGGVNLARQPVCNCPAIILGRPTSKGPPQCYCLISIAQNTTTISGQPNETGQVYSPSYELGNVNAVDPSATIGMFHCSADTDCIDVHTGKCFNNIAQQQACINGNYSASYTSFYDAFLNSGAPMACPQFFMAGSASCACINNGCSLVYSASVEPVQK